MEDGACVFYGEGQGQLMVISGKSGQQIRGRIDEE